MLWCYVKATTVVWGTLIEGPEHPKIKDRKVLFSTTFQMDSLSSARLKIFKTWAIHLSMEMRVLLFLLLDNEKIFFYGSIFWLRGVENTILSIYLQGTSRIFFEEVRYADSYSGYSKLSKFSDEISMVVDKLEYPKIHQSDSGNGIYKHWQYLAYVCHPFVIILRSNIYFLGLHVRINF